MWTIEQRAEYMKRYRAENKDQIKANKRYWHKKHPNKSNEYFKKYYEAHKNEPEFKAKRKETHKRWRERNRDKWNAYYRERYRKKQEQACTDTADCTTCEYAYHDNSYNECAVDGVYSAKERSKTFEGIAEAMAEQWG